MRFSAIAALFLLSACAGGSSDEPRLATEPTVRVAQAALAGGNPTIALQVAEAILAHQPLNVDALVVRGEAQTALGQTGPATTNFQRALQISPSSVQALLGLGRLRLASDPQAAEMLFEKALNNDPRNVAVLNNLGIARDLQHRHADAQLAYRKSLALAPDNSATLVNLGLSLAMAGDKKEALRVLQPVTANPEAVSRVRMNLANALTAAGDMDGAAKVRGAATVPNPMAGTAP